MRFKILCLTLAALVAGTIATQAATLHPTRAAGILCQSDPVLTLSDGTTLRIVETVHRDATRVQVRVTLPHGVALTHLWSDGRVRHERLVLTHGTSLRISVRELRHGRWSAAPFQASSGIRITRTRPRGTDWNGTQWESEPRG